MNNDCGYIYILTNPSFPEYVKIGYADDVKKGLMSLTEVNVFRLHLEFMQLMKLIHDFRIRKFMQLLTS